MLASARQAPDKQQASRVRFHIVMERIPFKRVHGSYAVWPEPEMVAFGALFRRGRGYAGLTQRQLEDRSGVSQSVISRFERGRAPGLSSERLLRMANAIGPRFPFGFCPHEHACEWPRKREYRQWPLPWATPD